MDGVLLPVTLVSTIVALTSAALSWRVWREARRRSEARIVALTAALGSRDADRRPAAVAPEPQRPGTTQRSTARLATAGAPVPVDEGAPLDAERHHPVAAAPSRRPARPADVVASLPLRAAGSLDGVDEPLRFGSLGLPASTAADGMFASAQPPASGSRLAVVVAVGLVVVGSAAFTVYRMSQAAPRSPLQTVAAPAATVETPALELVSLRHTRQGASWTITGLVRNPAEAPDVQRAIAVAFLFDKDGSFVGSGRAALDFARLGAGDESPFVVTLTANGPVERYRISFRGEDGKVLRHVDRRTSVPRS